MSRPQLPVKYANPRIQNIIEAHPPPQVKYQKLNCQGKEILVGRLKVETPTENGHAFILRRYDTGAVSLTTMFRAAFPLASEEAERAELLWVKENHDLSGTNGSSRESHITRLAGTWVAPELAIELGDQYAIGPLISIVVNATPDPNTVYKRSAKAAAASASVAEVNRSTMAASTTTVIQQASNSSIVANAGSMSSATSTNRGAVNSLPTPSPTGSLPNPPKRRKESSPAPQTTDASPLKTPLRRSNRAKSPALKSVTALTSANTPAKTPKKRLEQMTPVSDKDVKDEDGDKVEEVAAKQLHDEDVLEQKKLISDLKAQRAARAQQAAEDGAQEDTEANAGEEESTSEVQASKKRGREEGEPEYKLNIKEPEVGERAIATNRRVRFQMEPRTRSFAWGVAAFAVGMGAVSFIPSLF
ncbi:hypothetical protein NP233_g2298 [Leucocoprinus birnbaumii]|uniref:HTH APSES-type domain-containing protein n=1 Tax=Leucocoprinus birnbaumii TaxID=56174 RepID=A0AAD5VZ44_9AGAR|nr:hypothetical protein NP233_g2298 [Leucocoprinus birnbaumii]